MAKKEKSFESERIKKEQRYQELFMISDISILGKAIKNELGGYDLGNCHTENDFDLPVGITIKIKNLTEK
jgi:hypothetical protein